MHARTTAPAPRSGPLDHVVRAPRSTAPPGRASLADPVDVPVPDAEVVSAGWSRLARFGVGPFLVLLDTLAVAVGVLGMELVSRQLGLDSPARKTLAFGAVLLLLFWLGGLYRSRLSLSVLDDLPALTGRWLVAGALAVLGQIAWSRTIWADYIIDWQFLWGAVTIGVVGVALRAVGYAMVRRLRSLGLVAHRAVVVGAGRVGEQVASILQSHPEYGLHPIGFVDADPPRRDDDLPLPVLGGPQALTRVLEEWQVGNVVVAFSSMKESDMVGVIRACDRHRCELFVVPRLFELHRVDGD
ncbi:nucleoside-diphosphate sugar epimerase/dehydratase, partial [Geodermatophilus sp. SYSU D00965]